MKSTTLLPLFALGALSQNFSGQPACATPCLSSAITAAGCALADAACQCGPTQAVIAAGAVSCLLAACTNPLDLGAAQSAGAAACAAYSASATATGSAPATTSVVSSGTSTTVVTSAATITTGTLVVDTTTKPAATTTKAAGTTVVATTTKPAATSNAAAARAVGMVGVVAVLGAVVAL